MPFLIQNIVLTIILVTHERTDGQTDRRMEVQTNIMPLLVSLTWRRHKVNKFKYCFIVCFFTAVSWRNKVYI